MFNETQTVGVALIKHSTFNIEHSTFAFRNAAAMPTLKNATRTLLAVALLAGLTTGGEGLWIYAKAKLAQLLLEISWRSALAGEELRPWPWADTRAIARLTIERGGATIIVLAGASGRTMAFGPGHLDGTAMPGDSGNCVITAHRDTHFASLRCVGPGDILPLQRPDGVTIRYRVQATRVVPKTDTSVLRQDARTRLTLITCYPFDAIRPGTPLRWVVIAQKVA
jgi:sortase A